MLTIGRRLASTGVKELIRFFSTLGGWYPKFSNASSKLLRK